MIPVHPIYITTTIIEMFQSEEFKGSATGFFFKDEKENIYLITNKHVIYGEKFFENPAPMINKIKLTLHTDSQDLTKNLGFEVNLFEGEDKVWLEHENKEVDVILIPVNIDKDKYLITPIDKSMIESSDFEIIFEKIFIMGYPFGWYDQLNNLPITRIGHLSSPFRAHFQGKPIMLGDVETHKGMSGGPVFMKLDDFVTIKENKRTKNLGSSKIILVGIHSGQPRWDLKNQQTNETENIPHKLVHIWFADLILEILSKPN